MNRRLLGHSSRLILFIAIMAILQMGALRGQSAAAAPAAGSGVKIVLLGTGHVLPNPDHQGPSLAIVVNETPYIVDAGTGLVRQAYGAYQRGISAMRVDNLRVAFITHLHSDHTLGLPDLILSPWMEGRRDPLQLYGPPGIKKMADNILAAYDEDIQNRTAGGARKGNGYKVDAHEIHAGFVYQDENVRVTAFQVKHGTWKEPLGYRFDAGGKSIVVSGDTVPMESVVDACNGCDALVHEVHTGVGIRNPDFTAEQQTALFATSHTTATELGKLATKAKARILVLTHWALEGNATQDDLVREIRENYNGPIFVGRDLDVIMP